MLLTPLLLVLDMPKRPGHLVTPAKTAAVCVENHTGVAGAIRCAPLLRGEGEQVVNAGEW